MGFVSKTFAIGAGIIIAIPVVKTLDPPQPKPADIPAAQRTLDRAEAFLAARTRAPEERKTLEVGLPKWATDIGGVAGSLGDVIAAEPALVVSWARMDQDPAGDGWELEAARVALHEQGHALDDIPADPLDEGLRDTVALDLVPAFTFALTGYKAEGYGRAVDAGYPTFVTQVRALSARATCSRVRSYRARAWVVRVSVLPRAGRVAAAERAHNHVCGPR